MTAFFVLQPLQTYSVMKCGCVSQIFRLLKIEVTDCNRIWLNVKIHSSQTFINLAIGMLEVFLRSSEFCVWYLCKYKMIPFTVLVLRKWPVQNIC